MNNPNPNRLLSRKEAAEFLGVSETTLAIWKSSKRYPLPCIKIGGLAKYRTSDLLHFIESRTIGQVSPGAGHGEEEQ
jgi:predicted DNA-binding transcriptional regulator AlpA